MHGHHVGEIVGSGVDVSAIPAKQENVVAPTVTCQLTIPDMRVAMNDRKILVCPISGGKARCGTQESIIKIAPLQRQTITMPISKSCELRREPLQVGVQVVARHPERTRPVGDRPTRRHGSVPMPQSCSRMVPYLAAVARCWRSRASLLDPPTASARHLLPCPRRFQSSAARRAPASHQRRRCRTPPATAPHSTSELIGRGAQS